MNRNFILSGAAYCLLASGPMLLAQESSETEETIQAFSNEKIWYSGEFRGDYVDGLRSMNDGKHYTSLEYGGPTGTAIVEYAYKSGEATDTIATSVSIFGDAEKSFDSYSFSSDESRLLLTTNTESIYRHSFYADYHIHTVKTGETQPLTDFSLGQQRLAAFSPAADKVAFVRDNDMYIADLKAGVEIRVTSDGEVNHIINGATDWVYEEEFGEDNGMQWSPDGKHLAFYRFDESAVRDFSMPVYGDLYPNPYVFKYPKAGEVNSTVSIHVHRLQDGKRINVAIPRTEYIPRIKWSSDPNLLCLFTLPRHQNVMQIHVADMARAPRTGGLLSTRMRWEERSTTFIDVTDNITFIDEGKRFVTTSERDNFNHIYIFDFEKNEIQLTSGDWDVKSIIKVDKKRKEVYFKCAFNGATQQHIARVNFDGEMSILHDVPGHHGANFSKTCAYYIHGHSDANTPKTWTLRNRQGDVVRVLKDNASLRETLAGYSVQPKEFFTFENRSGVELNCWMIKPENFDPTKEYPVYVSIYGGPGVNTVTDNWGGANFYWHQLLAQEGYIVVSCDPRGTPLRGRIFEHSTYRELGKLETDDFIDFGRHLAEMDYVDGGRIGIQGWSYGGFMTLLCLTKGADVYAAGISVAPVSNWRYYDTIYTERFMRTPQENASGYDDNSPVNHAEKLEGSLLLVHGSGDDNVHFQNSMEMVNALVTAGKDFDFFAYPDRNHGIYGGNTRLHLFDMMLNFVKENF